ncbi:flagellar hook protein FlgE [Pseudomonadales bacterium]|nr:flagellar hook protein FlgE [Pseudomonadales bacterium]
MTFNTALTGLRAATSDLNVTGNNIANASTVGFKQSRAEFADVYASSVVGGGSNAIGNGVRVSDVSQQFSQGNISFTENALDLAINGGGFFVLSDQGSQVFTRAGQFGVDDTGYITTNDGARLQGFPANTSGTVSDVLGDLQLSTADISPRQTTLVDMLFNLDADATVPENIVNTAISEGAVEQAAQGATNGYAAGTIDIAGTTYTIPASANQSASVIAGQLSAINGVSASAITRADIFIPSGSATTNQLRVNGAEILGADITQITSAIDALPGITASESGGVISVVSTLGDDLMFTAGAGLIADVTGAGGGSTININGNLTSPANQATVGGLINLTMDADLSISAGTTTSAGTNLFPSVPALTLVRTNSFDPADGNTYNDATSVTIFDSLGSRHVLSQYFVKEPASLTAPNTWSMYVQIDGENVGDPDVLAPNVATMARFTLRFFNDGTLDTANSDQLLVSNWTPLDSDGNPAGALGPITVANGANTPIPSPPVSSNFVLDINGSSQFSGGFSVNELDQNGFSRGRLSSVDVSETGVIFARYSNGEALTLGRVALGSFANEQGLTPLGDSTWGQSFESGEPVIGAPRTASLGSVSSGALEDSNVELAEELVALIIAQRNFQANSRTIETANEIQQTIINLR